MEDTVRTPFNSVAIRASLSGYCPHREELGHQGVHGCSLERLMSMGNMDGELGLSNNTNAETFDLV